MLKSKQLNTHRTYVGDFITSMEMSGFSITLMKVDDELKKCIDHQVDCPNFTQIGGHDDDINK
ncbi:dihydroxyacetone kinase family protein [Staphylococcus aureus]|nr:dihydroxyacetone kinase family protein [Staphylococcus aureus]